MSKTSDFIIYLNCYLIDKEVRKGYYLYDYENEIDAAEELISIHFPNLISLPLNEGGTKVLIIRKDTRDTLTSEDIEILSNLRHPEHEIKLGTILGYTCPADHIIAGRGRVSFRFFINLKSDEKPLYLFAYVCNGMKHVNEAVEILDKIKVALKENPSLRTMKYDVGLQIRYLSDIHFESEIVAPIEEINEEFNESYNEGTNENDNDIDATELKGGRKSRIKRKHKRKTQKRNTRKNYKKNTRR